MFPMSSAENAPGQGARRVKPGREKISWSTTIVLMLASVTVLLPL